MQGNIRSIVSIPSSKPSFCVFCFKWEVRVKVSLGGKGEGGGVDGQFPRNIKWSQKSTKQGLLQGLQENFVYKAQANDVSS